MILMLTYSEDPYDQGTRNANGFSLFPPAYSPHVSKYITTLLDKGPLRFNNQTFYDWEDMDEYFEFREFSDNEDVFTVARSLGDFFILKAFGMFPRNWFDGLDAFVIQEEYIEEHNLL